MYTFVPLHQVRQVQYNFARSEDINEGALTVFSAENFMGAAFLCFEWLARNKVIAFLKGS